jgi:hypothetical protein
MSACRIEAIECVGGGEAEYAGDESFAAKSGLCTTAVKW